MTITTRSKRVSMFGAAPTPATVGPGAYAPEKTGRSFKGEREARPLHSGFATSDKRDLNANKTTSAITPGPGAYITSEQNGSPATLSNVFATKTSRFAPSAPGSTIYRPSSIQDNPGPGAYTPIERPSRPKTSPRYGSNNQSDDARGSSVRVATKPSVPTIPTKGQSYGYSMDPTSGELKLQSQPANMYTGIGQDTVGPAAYNSHGAIWNEKKNVAPSIKSTVKRAVWEEYDTPRRAVPGPGQYDPNRVRRARKHGDRPSAVFASRVPILPDHKPVAQHDEERELELQAKEHRLKPRSTRHNKVEAFGSTTGRVDISTHIDAPYSSPTFKATPGPGKYAERGPSNFSSFRGGSLNRSSHHARGTAYRDDHQIGFTSATERYCLSKPKPSTSPGPGAYKSETPRTVEKAVKSKQTVGRFGVFGSTSERRVWEKLETMEPDEVTPGPGAYEKPVDTHGGHFPMLASSAAFKSSSSRFAKFANPHASPHVVCVGDHAAPAVGQYNISHSVVAPAIGGGESPTSPVSSPLHSARAPFLSTAERSVFDPKEAKYVPGPGQYSDVDSLNASLTRSREVRPTLGNEERFRLKLHVPEHVGPGAYAIPGTVGTKSFNVTMALKQPLR